MGAFWLPMLTDLEVGVVELPAFDGGWAQSSCLEWWAQLSLLVGAVGLR